MERFLAILFSLAMTLGGYAARAAGDTKAAELLAQARTALGGESRIAKVQGLSCAGTVQRAHHPIFAFDGVCRRQQVAGRFAAEDQAPRRGLNVVGRIRLSAAELTHEQRCTHVWHPRAKVAFQGAHIESM